MNAMTKHLPALNPVTMDADTPAYDARDLIPDGVQAKIILDEQVYTLRITRAGKLILTK